MTYFSNTYGVEKTSGPSGEALVLVKDTKNNIAFSTEYSGEDLNSASYLKHIQEMAKASVGKGAEIVGESDFKTLRESGPVVIYSEAIEDYNSDGVDGLPALITSEQEKAVTLADFARIMKRKGLDTIVKDIGVFGGAPGEGGQGFLLKGQNKEMAHIVKIHKIDGVEPQQAQLNSVLKTVQSLSNHNEVTAKPRSPSGPSL